MQNADGGADRRQYARVNAPVYCRPLRLRKLFAGERRRAQDISAGGIRLFSDDEIKLGTRLELEVFLPDGGTIQLTARAVWVESLPPGAGATYDVGFEFVDISPADRARLAEHCAPVDDGDATG